MYKLVNGKKRIFYLDFIRAFAISLVVLAHVVRLLFNNSQLNIANMYTAPFIDFAVLGVPLFLMISGVLLLNRDFELSDFFTRRYSRVLIPFIFWAIVFAFFKIFINGVDLTLSSFFANLNSIEFWFVWMILVAYLFIPIINSFIKEYGMKGIEYFLILWFVVIIVNTIVPDYLNQSELIYYMSYVGYFVLGYYLANKKFNLSDNALLIISILIFLMFTAINVFYTVSVSFSTHELVYYKYLTIVTVMQAVGLFMFFRYFTSCSIDSPNSIKAKIYSFFKDSAAFNVIFSLSTFSYGIYLIHFMPLMLCKWFNSNHMPILKGSPIIWMPLIFIFVLVASWFVLWIFDKIPILNKVSGAH